MLIVSVLRCGKDFTPRHAQWLHRQFGDLPSVCLTDAQQISGVKTAPLLYDWPGWWAKLELFNPDHPVIGHEDLLYIDIDTVITGDLQALSGRTQMTMLTDFACEGKAGAPAASGIMFIPAREKYRAWNAFIANADAIMAEKKAPPFHGDQGFIGQIYPQAERWQTILPGKVISYKANIATPGMPGFSAKLHDGIADGSLPGAASIVCFHGSPRPWHTVLPWVPAFSLINTLKARVKQLKRKMRQPG